jgi:3-oxoacyl-[acyl-carrier protein] reductase
MNWEISFQITREGIEQFAAYTGDRNPLHLDEQFARRFRYREPVAHGMLAFSYLSFLASAFSPKQISFVKLAGEFRRPVFRGDEIVCSVECRETGTNAFSFSATWKNQKDSEEIIAASGEFSVTEPKEQTPSNGADTKTFLSGSVAERAYLVDELAGKKESLSFSISKSLAQSYTQMLLGFVSEKTGKANFIAPNANFYSTLLLSTLVGMQLPGKFATFLNFDVAFETLVLWNNLHTLEGTVATHSPAGSRPSFAVKLKNENQQCGQGRCSVLVNAPPKPMLTCDQIKREHSDLGLKNKVVLITGASRGIGEVTAKFFASLGAKVVVGYFKGRDDAQQIVCEITQSGGEAVAFRCDVRQESEVKNMVDAAMQRYGDIDVLVNNAVKDATPKSLLELEWDDFLGEMEVSLKGLHNCCKAVLPIFQEKKRGKIINLSTVTTDSPVAGQSKYITAKSAVVGYTRSLAKEFAKDNIQANLVAPNMVETDLHAALPSRFKGKLAEERDYGRHVQPIEVAQSIAFLASNWSDAMTGQKIVLNLGENPFL